MQESKSNLLPAGPSQESPGPPCLSPWRAPTLSLAGEGVQRTLQTLLELGSELLSWKATLRSWKLMRTMDFLLPPKGTWTLESFQEVHNTLAAYSHTWPRALPQGMSLRLQTQGWKLLLEGALGHSGPGLGVEATETEPRSFPSSRESAGPGEQEEGRASCPQTTIKSQTPSP